MTGYWATFVAQIIIYALVAQSFLLIRRAGYVSLAHGAWLGATIYLLAFSFDLGGLYGWTTAVLFLIAVALVSTLTAIAGATVFLVVSAAAQMIFSPFVNSIPSVTGGNEGLNLSQHGFPNIVEIFAVEPIWVVVALGGCQLVLVYIAMQSDWGRIVRAVGSAPSLAEDLGIIRWRVIGSVFLVGVVLMVVPALLYRGIAPQIDGVSFGLNFSLVVIVAAGIGSFHILIGPIVGSAAYWIIAEFASVIGGSGVQGERWAVALLAAGLLAGTLYVEKRARKRDSLTTI